jgi:hypothetical protein
MNIEPKRWLHLGLSISSALLLLALWVFLPTFPVQGRGSTEAYPEKVVKQAWELAQEAGSYAFNADLVQTRVPQPLVSNVGKHSDQQFARMEGQANLVERKLSFTLWSEGGNVLDASSGTQVRVEGEHAYVRQGDAPWEEIDDFTTSFAPDSDFLAFLSGAKNIQLVDPSTSSPLFQDTSLEFDRTTFSSMKGVLLYTFEVDGPGFARYLRDNLQKSWERQGKLPPGVALELSRQYTEMTGQGELWIGPDGLPLGQTIRVQFPPGDDGYQVQVDIQVAFSGFGTLPIAESSTRPYLFGYWSLGGFILLVGIFLWLGGKNRRIYASIIVVLISCMVFGPLLQQARAASFYRDLSDQERRQKARQEQNQQTKLMEEQLVAVKMDPQTSPLESAQERHQAKAFVSQLSNPSSQVKYPYPLVTDPSSPTSEEPLLDIDSDHDGLPDTQESLLGTDPFNPDTDGDTITDTLEVVGFNLGGKTWYGDPLKPDTNDDGVGDALEWGLDTDGDNTPDLWSRDNDSDGVPDNLDLSPFRKSKDTFDKDHPFQLVIQDLIPDKPTYVDIQLRPTNPSHIRYAFNVFYWPVGDATGQMQDVDGKTFKDVYPDSDQPQDANGNVKMVPLLEITITGQSTNLPDKEELDKYGISVRNLTEDGTQKAVYIPLQLVTDKGDNRTAFYARMFYRPDTHWGVAQQVRVIWAVLALVDQCKENGYKDGVCQDYDKYNQLQMLQTYYDSFIITGLNVREDHGTDWAIVYKDPSVLANPVKDSNRLTPFENLVFGLDRSFLSGRVGANHQRDMTVQDIYQRFDHTINSTVPITDRFGIQENIFRVDLVSKEHIDEALQQITVTETKSILNAYTSFWSSSAPITPTLLFAHEERFRPLNLDTEGNHENVAWNSRTLTLRLPASASQAGNLVAVEEHTLVGLNWAPYLYKNNGWTGCPLDVYLDALDRSYPLNEIDSDTDVAQGGLDFLKIYYANIYQGYIVVVKVGDFNVVADIALDNATIQKWINTWQTVNTIFRIGISVYMVFAGRYNLLAIEARLKLVFKSISARISGKVISSDEAALPEFGSIRSIVGKLSVGLMILVIAAMIYLAQDLMPKFHDWLTSTTMKDVFKCGIAAVVFTLGFIKTATFIVAYMKRSITGSIWDFSRAGQVGFSSLLVITVILIAFQVAVFIYLVLHNHVKIFSAQFDRGLAELIASIIVFLILTAISAIPFVGPLIVSIMMAINLLVKTFTGFSYIAWITEAITYAIYGYNLMVGIDANPGATHMALSNPDLGLSVGNSLSWDFPITTTVTMTNPKAWQAHAWMELYTKESLLSSSIEYELDTITKTVAAYRGQRTAEWSPPEQDHTYLLHKMYRVRVTDKLSSSGVPINRAGVNQEIPLYLNTGYSLPAIECWTAVIWPMYTPVPICYRRSANGQNPQKIPYIYLDIFPRTLDEFYQWNWSNNDALAFREQKDHDNDGLISRGYWGGNDPNDGQWDSDLDNLSDYYEVTMRSIPPSQGGAAFDPLNSDTDGDGLRDDEEVRNLTDPASGDSDGDRRGDGQEVNGYQFTYTAGKTTLVRSNPISADPDHDGINDYSEYYLHSVDPVVAPYNPNVWNVNPFVLTTAVSAHERYLTPGATLWFTATLQDQLHTTWVLNGEMTTTLPSGVHGSLPPFHYQLNPGEGIVQTAHLTLDPGMPSQTATLPTRACAKLETPLVYLPFETHYFDPRDQKYVYTNTLNYRYDAFCYTGYHECPTQVPGAPGTGTALEFGDGKLLRIDQSTVDLSFTDHQPFSLAAWVYWKGYASAHMNTLFSKVSGFKEAPDWTMQSANGDFFLGITPLGQIEFTSYTEDNVIDPEVSLQENWNHILVSYDGSKHSIYLNGNHLDMTEDEGMCWGGPPCLQPPYKQWTMMIGSNILDDHYPGIAGNFHGKLDEVYVFDRVLNQREINVVSHPSGGLAPFEPGAASCDLQEDKEISFVVDADHPRSSITSLADGSYISDQGILIVGGEAHDPSSYVTQVAFSVGGGGWERANGAASWAYAWSTNHLAEGSHLLRSRATDAVGLVETPSSGVTVILDRTPPTVHSGGLDPDGPSLGMAKLDPLGRWILPLKGEVTDPPVGSHSGSGVKSIDILLKGGLGVAGHNWQPAILQGNNWTVNYSLPRYNNESQGIIKPTGCYTLWGRGTDKVGNSDNPSQYFETSFCLDNTPPASSLNYTGPSTTTITATVTLNGIVEDTGSNGAPVGSGVSQLQVAFVPADVADVVNENVLMMHLDEPANSQVFRDGSPGNNSGVCASTACPVAGLPGKIDQAVQFDGVDDVIDLGNPPALQITGTTIAVASWFKTSATGAELRNRSLVSKWDSASGRGAFKLGWNDSEHLSFSVRNQSNDLAQVDAPGQAFNDGNWHLAMGVDMGADFYLYVDGNWINNVHHSGFGSLSNPSLGVRIGAESSGGFFPGMIDEVMVFPYGLTAIQAQAVNQWGEIAWNLATLANPGAMSTTWSYAVPSNLDGVYQIDLRSLDVLGNLNQYRSTWNAWRGEIDTRAPVVEVYRGDFDGNKKQVLCEARDFNLVRSDYQCTCSQSLKEQFYYQVSDWYRTVTTDTHRLYSLVNQCFYFPNQLPSSASVQACDRYGRCSSASTPLMPEPPNQPEQASLPISSVISPTNETVLTSLSPISLTVEAEAENYLKDVNVYLDGVLTQTFSFPSGAVTYTLTSTTWTPPSQEGFHTLRSSAWDWMDQQQVEWITNTLYVDLNPPNISIDSQVITSSRRLSYPGVNLTGAVSDNAGVRTVDVSIQDGAWMSASLMEDDVWRLAWLFPSSPDGISYDVDARAIDLGGYLTQISQPITVDIVAPTPITLSLSYQNSQGMLTPIHAGDVISDVLDPTLILDWTEAVDGSGVRDYLAGLVSTEDAADPTLLTPYSPSQHSHSQQVQEGRAYVAYVASTDVHGNRRWQNLGPIYVDTPQTPDYIPLQLNSLNMSGPFDVGEGASPASYAAYHGWMDSGCSLVGTNRIISETANALSSLSEVQRLYATWNEDALRLTWLGGDWDGDGDLFIYLDSLSSSGTSQAYNPFPGDPSQSVTLPILADFLVWVQQTNSAEIRRWDGSEWIPFVSGSEQMHPYYRFTHQADGDSTDLYLPFSLLDIVDPSTQGLGLAAFATEQDRLRLWTVMPLINPHDSSVLGNFPYQISEIPVLPLINAYHWNTLAAHQCPHQDEYLDVDLRGILSAAPSGVITETRLGGLFLAGNLFSGRSNSLLGDAQPLAYKLRYIHIGSDASPGSRLVLTSEGSLYLDGGELLIGPDGVAYYQREIDLGELLPHSIGEFDFSGTVDVDFMRVQYQDCLLGHPPEECSHLLDLTHRAAINARLYTELDPNNPIESLRIEHPLDVDPPTEVFITDAQSLSQQGLSLLPRNWLDGATSQDWHNAENLGEENSLLGPETAMSLPAFYVHPGEIVVRGTARDLAGVVEVTIQVLDPYGDTTDFICDDLVPQSDQWTCSIDIPSVNNGDRFFIHALARDVFGYESDWSPWRVLLMDTLLPTIDLDENSASRLSNLYFSLRSNTLIYGEVQDNFQASGAKICVDQSGNPSHPLACQIVPVQSGDGITGTWSYELPIHVEMDGVAHTLILYGLDAASNLSGEPLTRTFYVDSVPPQINLDTYTPIIRLGDYQLQPIPLLTGSAWDGSGIVDVVVLMTHELSGTMRSPLTVTGGDWQFQPELTLSGDYSLRLEVRDRAGNVTYLGPFPLEVVDWFRYWYPFIGR